jgi:uncharacterized protein (UPF0276 family)
VEAIFDVGINFSLGFLPWLPQARQWASCLEMPVSPFYSGSRKMLGALRSDWRMVLTAGGLNLGSTEELDLYRLRSYGEIAVESGATWMTEPLGFQEHHGRRFPYSLPPRPERLGVRRISDKAKAVMDGCQRLLLLQVPNRNLTVGSYLEQVEFLNRICAESGCGLAVDLSALAATARLHGFTAAAWLRGIEGKNIQQLDLAGESLGTEEWKLLELTLSMARPRAVFVQRHENFRGVQELEAALSSVNEIRRVAA